MCNSFLGSLYKDFVLEVEFHVTHAKCSINVLKEAHLIFTWVFQSRNGCFGSLLGIVFLGLIKGPQ